MANPDTILRTLECLQLHPTAKEFEIHEHIKHLLSIACVQFQHEYILGPRARVDFLCAGGIAIEVKKGKPNSRTLEAQAARYAAFDAVTVVILVVEQNVFQPPEEVHGKPVYYVSLAKNWGITV